MSSILLCYFLILTVIGIGNTQTLDTEPLNEWFILECTDSAELRKTIDGLEEGSVDVWDNDEKYIYIHVTKESKETILESHTDSCPYIRKDDMIEDILDNSVGRIEVYDFTTYLSYDQIMTFYDNEIVAPYEALASKTDIGGTFKGNRMYAIQITATTPPGDNDPPTPKIYLQCLIHAREWISGPVCMYIAKKLCEEYTNDDGDEDVKELLRTLEFVIVPVVNPDGYKVHHETYKTKKGHEVEKQTSGVFIHWAYDGDIKNTNGPRIASFAIELRPKLPATEILLTCEEIFPAIVYLAKIISESPLPAVITAQAADQDQQNSS